MSALVQHDGLYWPAADRNARPALTAEVAWALPVLLQHVRGRDVIVQAGANVGLYPLALADHFQRVITCEPDPVNFACLQRNLAARDSLGRVTASFGAFGEVAGEGHIIPVEPDNCGAHRIDLVRHGAFPVVSIDSLQLPVCNAIWLDIEGVELLALKGAQCTIERCSPTIAVEDKGHHRTYGIDDGALDDWLEARGYEQVDRVGNDRIFTRTA